MSYHRGEPPVSEAGEAPNEHDLVLHAQQGDQQAFETLYERYNNRLSRYLARMVGDDGVGCELTQETFLKAWEALPGLRDPMRFTGWLYRIATNLAYTHQSRARLIQTVPWEEFAVHAATLSIAGPEKFIEETELMKLVLAHISPTYRPCFVLYVIEKLPQRQIADILGIKLTSVGKYVSRGKEEFRQIYYRLMNEVQEKEERT